MLLSFDLAPAWRIDKNRMTVAESRDKYNFLIDSDLPTTVKHGYRFFLGSSISDSDNPFLLKTYDFDDRFYQGKFEFIDPLSGSTGIGTPEEYGRRRLVTNLSKLDPKGKIVLDLGAGTLNIYRQLPADIRQSLQCFVNCDISGPWSAGDESSMEIGSRRANLDTNKNNVANIQYDFNSNSWPFRNNAFDFIVSCMAVHHAKFETKARVLESIFRSLKPGGKFAIIDFFLKQEGGARFTDAGQRGPEECKGYGQPFSDFLTLCRDIGFTLDEFCKSVILNKTFLTQDQLELAVGNVSKTLQINKAIWFTTLSKK